MVILVVVTVIGVVAFVVGSGGGRELCVDNRIVGT